MIHFESIKQLVFNPDGACEYLGLESTRALERLIQEKRLTPLRITKENRFARSELDSFIERELERERRLRDTDNGEAS